MERREFIKKSAVAGLGLAIVPSLLYSNQTILTRSKTLRNTALGELIFKPVFVQKGRGPHLLDWAYASDIRWDAFFSNVTASNEGVKISDTNGKEKFGIDVRWNVEGFGYIFITGDNGGEFYQLPPEGKQLTLNLNYELAKSRVARNKKRLNKFSNEGYIPSREIKSFIDLSEEYFEDAKKSELNIEKLGLLSQQALYYAMWGGEKLELENAKFNIQKIGYRSNFFIGCDARGYYQMDPETFMKLFTDVFNYATITYYLESGFYEDFEPQEGKKQFEVRDVVFKRLKDKNITVEGRPLYWPYKTVTPDWLRNKSYDEILKYVEKHVKEVVGHYGDQMYAWEIVNESHDWANETKLTPEQIINVTKLACEVAKETNPKVHRLINNCCPYAEYVQLKKWGELDAEYPQRTPFQFMEDLVNAGVDFTITGQQMYFPYRDLQDTIILIERLEKFSRPVQLTEVGASSGPNKDSIMTGRLGMPEEPYIWHGHWTQELQADWLEGLYTLVYSKPWIEAVNWYDFVDPYSWIKQGGLLESPKGEKKLAYDRLLNLQKEWRNL
ncbi:MAG: endo-1,4-beta-xylanase [Ignavibacteria bacterium]|nr:endo-1,4-beta-xylanase [Ignavibacteria bacterium]